MTIYFLPLRAANIFCSAAVRAEIRAIDKLKLAHDVKEQKLHEAQDIAEIVINAEEKIGELLKAIPSEITGRPIEKSRGTAAPTFTSKTTSERNS